MKCITVSFSRPIIALVVENQLFSENIVAAAVYLFSRFNSELGLLPWCHRVNGWGQLPL